MFVVSVCEVCEGLCVRCVCVCVCFVVVNVFLCVSLCVW